MVNNREKQLKEEMNSVKQLGERIGYGNLMSWASALWRKSLSDDGYPVDGVFVPRIGNLEEEEIIYDDLVRELSE